jgi:hypothetical protein
MKITTKQLVLTALFLAIGILLPMVFHSFGISGLVFLPMHIPVLLCGLVCGWSLGGIVGLVLPFISLLLTARPPLYPVGISMALELASYGIVAGLLYKGEKSNIFVALIGAMLAGRLVMGIANVALLGLSNETLSAFISGAFVTALPGIILQLVLIPAIVLGLEKAKLI